METNKITLSESQLRLIIRNELKTYLFENGLLNEQDTQKIGITVGSKLRTALILALMVLGGENKLSALGGEGGGGEGQGGMTIEELLDEAGMTKKVLSELDVNLTKEDLKTINKLYHQEKKLELQAKKAEELGNAEMAKELKSKSDKVMIDYLRRNPEAADRYMETGRAIVQYIYSLPPEAIEGLGDPKEAEALKIIQSNALSYQIKPETQTKNITQAAVSDLNNIFSIAVKETGYGETREQTIISWAVENYDNDERLPQEFNLIDIIKLADSDGKIESELLDPENFTERRVKELSDTLPNMSKDQAKATYFGDTADTAGIQKENKINKLRKRLNETRGLYV
jgi:uncharacterized protein YlxP (DUF503 family)